MLQISYRMERRCILYQFQARIAPLLPLSNTIDVSCDYNFVPGGGRVKPKTAIKPAFSILLYGLVKASYGSMAKLFGITPAAV